MFGRPSHEGVCVPASDDSIHAMNSSRRTASGALMRLATAPSVSRTSVKSASKLAGTNSRFRKVVNRRYIKHST